MIGHLARPVAGLSALAVVATFVYGSPNAVAGASPPNRNWCIDAASRQFDFWVGDWDVFDVDQPTKREAHARVEVVLDGCVIHEIYDGENGSRGESFTVYDVPRKVWHQSWVTNHGQFLEIEGEFRDGELTLSGRDRDSEGRVRLVWGTWRPVTGGVRETAARSVDGGKTWVPWFDIVFRPHRA